MPYKMPFNVTFRSPDGETFIETVCADSTYEARSICHSMYDATIVHVEHATVHPHCVIETEVPNGIQSIIYSSVNKWAAWSSMRQVKRRISERHTLHVSHRNPGHLSHVSISRCTH